MKKVSTYLGLLVLFVIFIAVCNFIIDRSDSVFSSQTLASCYQYESQGSLKKGSCACAKILYPDFSQSYDWMDACKIEQSAKL